MVDNIPIEDIDIFCNRDRRIAGATRHHHETYPCLGTFGDAICNFRMGRILYADDIDDADEGQTAFNVLAVGRIL